MMIEKLQVKAVFELFLNIKWQLVDFFCLHWSFTASGLFLDHLCSGLWDFIIFHMDFMFLIILNKKWRMFIFLLFILKFLLFPVHFLTILVQVS